MIFGILLILGGVLIALYPQLLSLIVASVLIFAGLFILLVGFKYRRTERRPGEAFYGTFMKFDTSGKKDTVRDI